MADSPEPDRVGGASAAFPGPDADVRALSSWWRDRPSTGYPVEWLRKAADRFLRLDAPLLAYDVTTQGLQQVPDDAILRRWQALALARSGSPRPAQAILYELAKQRPDDEETLGLLARTYKDLAMSAESAAECQDALRHAFEIYSNGYRMKVQNYWLGINAATIAVLRGDPATAASIAESVNRHCRELVADQPETDGGDYWLPATIGEAELIRGHVNEAARWYRRAVKMATGHWGSIATMRRNATLLLSPLSSLSLFDAERVRILRSFPQPQIVLFAGHMIDRTERRRPRLPDAFAPQVYQCILAELQVFGGHLIGYSSAACGSDILFLEAILALGGEAHVVLPYDRDDFGRDCVDYAGPEWRARFETVMRQATDITITSPRQKLSLGRVSHEYASDVLTGLAISHAGRVDGVAHSLAVWDGKPDEGSRGTASIVERWQGKPVEPLIIIDPAPPADRADPVAGTDDTDSIHVPAETGMEVRAIMFLDVVRFSQLAEEQMPAFIECFLHKLGELASVDPPSGPLVKESRGDGVYFVFENIRAAGLFALQVNDVLRKTAWGETGLPEDFSARISLHAGPVYGYICPFLGCATYTGTHVNMAARIEQSTPVGQVYASQQFAALSCEAGVTEFHCGYAGPVLLPKNFGSFPLYHVTWSRN